MSKRYLLAGAGAVLCALLAASPAQAERVGRVALIQVYGYETPPAGEREPIYVRDDVVANTVLETVRDGRMDVRFLDETQLIVGPSSKVTVDRFVYDPGRGAGDATLNVGKGVMRFVTGRMASRSYKIATPSATMGVRGTDFIVAVDDDGGTAVSVLSGGVSLTSTGGQTVDVDAGFTAVTDGADVSTAPSLGLPAVATASFGVSDESDDSDSSAGEESGEGGGE